MLKIMKCSYEEFGVETFTLAMLKRKKKVVSLEHKDWHLDFFCFPSAFPCLPLPDLVPQCGLVFDKDWRNYRSETCSQDFSCSKFHTIHWIITGWNGHQCFSSCLPPLIPFIYMHLKQTPLHVITLYLKSTAWMCTWECHPAMSYNSLLSSDLPSVWY